MTTSIQDKIKENLTDSLRAQDYRKDYISGNSEEWNRFINKLDMDIAYMQDVLELLKDCTLTWEEYLILEKIFTA